MADFDAHINQAKKNFRILESLNSSVPNSWDWQVTTAYYVTVHLMNAHIARVAGLHYKSHEKVKNALFKDGECKIDENIYLKYVKLEGLSRRARYLCNEDSAEGIEREHLTYDRHLSKAAKYVDAIMSHMAERYGIDFDPIEIDCIDLKNSNLTYIQYVPAKKAA